MKDPLEKLASGYQDLYAAPNETRNSELEFKLLDMEWEGEYIAAPAVVPAATPGIPMLLLTRRNSLREWAVELRKNSVVVFSDLERGTIGTRPLYEPPTKAMKPRTESEERGRKPEPGEGHVSGAIRHIAGESLPEPLPKGEYALAFISWDYLSNQRRVKKEGVSTPIDPAIAAAAWPWNRWTDIHAFKAVAGSPPVEGEAGVSVKVEGEKADRKISGALVGKARVVNIIPPDPKRVAYAEIKAGINVYLLLFSLDKYPPKSAEVAVPILGSIPIHAGDTIKGWFTIPFPFEPSVEDRMLYVVADGNVIGPIKIPGEKELQNGLLP